MNDIILELSKNQEFWLAVAAFFGLVGSLSWIWVLAKKKINVKSIELPGFEGKGVRISLANTDADKEVFRKHFTPVRSLINISALLIQEKDAAAARKESFLDKTLRDAEGQVTNMIADIHSDIESSFALALDFLYSFDGYVQTQILSMLKTTLKDNHLTSRAPGSKEYLDYLQERSLTMSNILIMTYADRWPVPLVIKVEEPIKGKYHPTGYEIRKFLLEEKRNDKIKIQFQNVLKNFIDASLKREQEEGSRLGHLQQILKEQFQLEDDTIKSTLDEIVPGMRFSLLLEQKDR